VFLGRVAGRPHHRACGNPQWRSDAAVVEAASEADPNDPEFVAEYTAECGRVASRIMRAIAPLLGANNGRRVATLDGLGRSEESARH
jgi:hypothetical protein